MDKKKEKSKEKAKKAVNESVRDRVREKLKGKNNKVTQIEINKDTQIKINKDAQILLKEKDEIREIEKKIPYLTTGENGQGQLIIEEKPFLMLGGELHNSSYSDAEYMEREVWPYLRKLHLNTVILPMAWENIEPEEGKFTFILLDELLKQCRREGVKVVLLWFGLWKNGESFYVPAWVKEDTRCFERACYRGGLPSYTISPFCEAAVEADQKAFASMMKHLKEFDAYDRTVIMVQIENEIGFRESERDFGKKARALYLDQVPEDMRELYKKENGSWHELFDRNAPEYFMAYYYAHAIEAIASAGKKEYPLPFYMNVWLDHHPSRPGVFPTGGPEARIYPIWKRFAPSIDLFEPDIYEPNFKEICLAYKKLGNPLMIPEARRDPVTASNAFYAFGGLDAICFSPFGPEDFLRKEILAVDTAALEDLKIETNGFTCYNTAPYFIRSYEVLSGMLPEIVKRQGSDRMIGFIRENPDVKGTILPMKGYDLQLDYLPQKAGEPGAAGIIFVEENGFYIAGCNVRFTPVPVPGSETYITPVTMEEGCFENGVWKKGRILNGDESYQMSLGAMAEVKYVRIAVHSYEE